VHNSALIAAINASSHQLFTKAQNNGTDDDTVTTLFLWITDNNWTMSLQAWHIVWVWLSTMAWMTCRDDLVFVVVQLAVSLYQQVAYNTLILSLW